MAENKTPPDWYTGNISLFNRPKYRNKDGSISTVYSMSFYDSKSNKEVLVPTIIKRQGQPVKLSEKEAIQRYYVTGKHLGRFDTPEQADIAARRIHRQQNKLLKRKQP
ncbi:MAG: hypothetical protein EBT80_10425 [Chitinophagales bacterium]|nr:hypothetical protein [Chitinophagales bacterium]